MVWPQVYDPLHNRVLSTLLAALPVAVLLGGIALLRLRAHVAALLGLATAVVITLAVYRMPVTAASGAMLNGAAYGLFPVGWIVVNLIFLYQLTVAKGWFAILRESVTRVTPDARIQLILVAFALGAFFEGAAGFGTPVAVTSAILIQLGFKPLPAAGLSLIANTAPVAFGSIGIPIIALSGVTGLDIHQLSAMIGRQLPFFSLIVPAWVVGAFAGWRGLRGVWPAALAAGGSFAIVQFLVSNYIGPWLVDTFSAIASMGSVLLLLRFWRPKTHFAPHGQSDQGWGDVSPRGPLASVRDSTPAQPPAPAYTPRDLRRSWLPWIVLTVLVFIWGLPQTKLFLDHLVNFSVPIAGLNGRVQRMPPVILHPVPEKALFALNLLSATGTGILVAAIVSGLLMGFSPRRMARIYVQTIYRIRHSLLTISAMLALGTLTRFGGMDATLGLALAKTGSYYPFFGTMLGWLGVALTGSDTASNVLFGSLQTITARQIGISPILMSAANSSGGVMGKMIDAQSIVVASTMTDSYGQESSILRFVFLHSIALAVLVALLVYAQATISPFTHMVVH